MHITDDLYRLLEIVPDQIRRPLQQHQDRNHLIEIVMDLGRLPEARFPSQVEYLGEIPVSRKDLSYSIERIGTFSSDNRAGIEQTLHRISAMRNRKGEVIGLTCRVGRAVFGTIAMIRELVETGRSILMLGRPGVGKTTALREIARVLADELEKRVVIIDTSNEIAGDGDVPHTAIGRARRMQVASPEQQHRVMIEAVENHTPEVIVIDEIGTELEALAARTIAERGVQLVGTAHGNQIENLLKNPTLCDLIGGIQAVTLGDDEARRRGSQKTVLERKAPPTFEIAVEMLERHCWVVHEQVADTVDALLRGKKPNPEVRTMDDNGEVKIKREFNGSPGLSPSLNRNARRLLAESGEMLASDGGFRNSGYMMPLPNTGQISQSLEFSEAKSFEQLLDESLSGNGMFSHSTESRWEDKDARPNGEDLPLHIYPYAIPRHQMEQAITTLGLPVVLTKDIDSADVILALRSHTRKQSKLRHVAKTRHVPIHVIKNSGLPQIAKALRRLLDMEDPATPEFAASASEDEMEALEETRLAVEQIVIPKGQPVELLPRSPKVRKMQHELVEHYRLKSASFGDEPNRRLRIYPA
ncbi:MAG: AAA family ATPase [Trichodesmium sp. MAG_R03]|nr:AAA family ATPase [Trichodesmium sp. MAG_R03]